MFSKLHLLVLWTYISSIFDENNGLAVGRQMILKSSDGGDNWLQINSFKLGWSTLRSVNFGDNNICWVVGEAGRVFKSTDSGTTWFEVLLSS